MMARTQFAQTVKAHLERTPFKPFTIEMEDGRQFVVERPESLWYGPETVLFTPTPTVLFTPTPTGILSSWIVTAVKRIVETSIVSAS